MANGFKNTQVTVDTTGNSLVLPANHGRRGCLLVQLGTVDVWWGDKGVTSTTGQLLPGTKGANIPIDTDEAIYAAAATGTATIGVTEYV